MEVRPLTADDYPAALAKVDAWFGESIHEPLHPVFFHHFGGYAVEDSGELIGFLIGFRSVRDGDVAYIHLIAIDPGRRGEGIGGNLYDRFERQARVWGSTQIEAVADPANESAREFHAHRDFSETLVEDWAGPGQARYLLRKRLAAF